MKSKKRKWTLVALRQSAKQYKSVKAWRVAEPSAYATASQRKLLPLLTKSMTKRIVHGYWTKRRILISAKAYKHRGEWAKAKPSAYGAARRLGLLDQASAHMTRLGNRRYRCIYIIRVIGTKYVYVGLTGNYERRIRDHMRSTRFTELTKRYGKSSIRVKQLTDYISSSEAVVEEIAVVNRFENDGYKVLNIAQPGALGGNVIKWTNVAILKEAQKYKSVKEWFTKSPQSYVAASTKKLIRSASRNMVREIRRPGSWTKKDVRLSAQKFSSFKEWIDKDRKSYGAAQRLGLLNNKSIVGHLSKRLMPARKWTASSIKSEGGKYKSRAEWKRRSSGSYKAAKRCGLFDEIVSRMQRPAVQKKWTIQTILAEAKKHKTREIGRAHV